MKSGIIICGNQWNKKWKWHVWSKSTFPFFSITLGGSTCICDVIRILSKIKHESIRKGSQG